MTLLAFLYLLTAIVTAPLWLGIPVGLWQFGRFLARRL